MRKSSHLFNTDQFAQLITKKPSMLHSLLPTQRMKQVCKQYETSKKKLTGYNEKDKAIDDLEVDDELDEHDLARAEEEVKQGQKEEPIHEPLSILVPPNSPVTPPATPQLNRKRRLSETDEV